MVKTQDDRVLDYLKHEGRINPLEAWKELGVYRLSACIHRLRNEGVDIVTTRMPVINQFGEECNVADYILN